VTRKSAIVIGSTFTALCAAGLIVGIALLVAAYRLPAHSDEARARELTIQYEHHFLDSTPEVRDSIEQKIIPLRTSYWSFYRIGLVLCLTTPMLLAAIIRFKLWDIRMLRFATTPQTRLRLLLLASVAWLSLLPAILQETADEFTQDDLTWAIDTGNGMFAFVLPPFFLITWIVSMLVGRFIVLRKAKLPANLWSWDSDRPSRSLVWTVLYGFLAGIIAILVLLSWWYRNGWYLPGLLVGLYVTVSTRAALLNGGGISDQPLDATPSRLTLHHKSTTT
jgi:hypothetical protein